MLLQSREAVEAFFTNAPPSTSLFVDLATNGQRPGDPKPTVLRGIALSFGERDTTAFVPADATDAIAAVVSRLPTYAVSVWDVYEEALAYATIFNRLLPVRSDSVLARHLLRPRLSTLSPMTTVPKAKTPEAMTDRDLASRACGLYPAMHGDVEQHYESMVTYGQQVPYEIELRATRILALASAQGYLAAGARVYPTWRTTHPSGSTNVTAGGPPLTSLSAIVRREYVADPGFRWVQIDWPAMEVAVLAARTGSPWLKAAYRTGDPYTHLGKLWDVTDIEAHEIFVTLLQTGPDEVLAAQKGVVADCVRDLVMVAPEWVEWGARLRETAATDYGYVTSFLGRAIKVDEPRKACALDVQATTALLLKMLLVRVCAEGEMDPRVFAGFRCPIPVYTKLAYQIDAHVPLDVHIPAALRCGALFAAADLPLRATISMGPSWGHLTPVMANSPTSQVEQELLLPGSYFWLCSLCERTAPDEATLREHLADAHNLDPNDVTNFEAAVERAKTRVDLVED
jgi:hypothetical protein